MKFSKKITLNSEVNVEICLGFEPLFSEDNLFLFGFPIGFVPEVHVSRPSHLLHSEIAGYWTLFNVKNGELLIVNDITGGFRLYYAEIKSIGKYFISDRFQLVVEWLENNGVQIGNNYNSKNYLIRHSYTLGSDTIFDEVHKIAPCSLTSFGEKGVKSKIVFDGFIDNSPNYKLHTEKVKLGIDRIFESLKVDDYLKILLFSGGSDSLFLASKLKEKNIDFIPVFLTEKKSKDYDREKAFKGAEYLDIPLTVIDYFIDESIPVGDIISNQILDRHYSFLHYYGIKAIVEKYGKNIMIINGQSSDSILSYGPSELSIQSYLKRIILYGQKKNAKIPIFIFSLIMKEKFTFPSNYKDKIVSFLDEYRYCFANRKIKNSAYKKYIYMHADRIVRHCRTVNSGIMYAKIFSFLQGSDNQVVINSAKYHGVEKIVMPYACPEIIYDTVKYKDDFKEIWSPKYAIKGSQSKSMFFIIIYSIINRFYLKVKENTFSPPIALKEYEKYIRDYCVRVGVKFKS